jgi:DNA-binding NarL/FixJ family response regulator
VVDDQEELHAFFKELGDLGHFQLGGACFNAAEALKRLPAERPDAVIMDIRLPDMSGIDCTTKLKTVLPGLPIIMLTGYPDGRVFFRSLMAGAKGFLVKAVPADEIVTAIGDVLQGGFALSKQVVPFLLELIQQLRNVTRESQLTKREEEILACLFEGMQDKEIAATLGIGTATVHTHMHRLFEKLGVHSRQSIIGKYLALDGKSAASASGLLSSP